VRHARLAAVVERARGDFDEHVGLGRVEAVDAGRPVTDARKCGDRPPARRALDDGAQVEPARFVDEAVAGRDGDDLRHEPIAVGEPWCLRVKRA
jgi:hypothetical protein